MSDRQPTREHSHFRLIGKLGDEPRTFDLKAGENHVGSRTEADVCLPETVISRHHAVIRVDDQGVEVEDLSSTNGTFVNGVRIKTSVLKEGDSLSFGSIPLTIVVPDDEARLAFRITPAPAVRGRDDSTELAQPNLGSHALILTAREVCRVLLGSAPPDIGGALSALATGIHAESACHLRSDGAGKPTVAGLWGPVEHINGLKNGRFFREFSTGLTEEIASTSIEGDHRQVIAVRTDGHRWTDSIVVTGAPTNRHIGPLLELVLLILSSTGSAKSGIGPAIAKAAPDLVLPDDHVRGHSPVSVRMYGELKRALADSAAVLVTGETGAGKEHAVRTLHLSSPRATRPFEAVNCAAIPADLLEAELFASKPGSPPASRAARAS